MAEQAKHERITPERMEKLGHRLEQVGLGYDTGALARIYTTDVRYLMKEVELLRAELQTAVEDGTRGSQAVLDEHAKQLQQAKQQAEVEVQRWKDQMADTGSDAAEELDELRRRVESAEAQVKFQKPAFDWPWVAQVGAPAECMTMCLKSLSLVAKIVKLNGDEVPGETATLNSIANIVQEPLGLFGDPLAPKQVLESRTVNWPTVPTEAEIKQARNDMELM